MKTWAKARDANETEIVDALRVRGCKVHRLEGGPGSPGVLDLLVEAPDNALASARLALAARLPVPFSSVVADALRVIADRCRRWVLLEVKDLDARAAYDISQHKWLTEFATLREEMPMAVRNRLKESQAMFLMGHTAPMAVVTSVEEALAAVGLESE